MRTELNNIVFKVQRPLWSSGKGSLKDAEKYWFFYDETRSFEFLGEATKELITLMGPSDKMYVVANLVPVPGTDSHSFVPVKRLPEEEVPTWW